MILFITTAVKTSNPSFYLFVAYLTNSKGSGRKQLWSNLRYCQHWPGEAEENHKKTSVRIASVLVEIQTRYANVD
jgi:hypothetical protein